MATQMYKHSAEETVNPELLVVGNCRYRINRVVYGTPSEHPAAFSHDLNEEEADEPVTCGQQQQHVNIVEPEEEELDDIEQIWDNKFKLSRPIASAFCRFIIGKKGQMKRELEAETRTTITIPNQGVEGQVVISGSTRADVASCWRRIQLLVDSGRRKWPPTHFVSIPMTSKNIQARFEEFKAKVIEQCHVDPTIFQAAQKLHLTVGMLTLMNDAERANAANTLLASAEDVVRPQLRSENWTLSMKGIEVMNDDPAAVDVLYAKVHLKDDGSRERLQQLVDSIAKFFKGKGLMLDELDRIKLHVTLINSKYRKEEETNGTSVTNRLRQTFDARQILKDFGDFDFGEQQLNSIQLSNRHGTGDQGYYYCLKEVKLG